MERAVDDFEAPAGHNYMKVQTLNHRIGQNTVDLINYEIKRDITGDNKRITGKALLLSEIPNLSIIEVTCENESVKNDILTKLSEDDVVVKTNSGLHIYANSDMFNTKTNFKNDNYSVHIMDSSDSSLVVMAGSRVRKNHKSQIYKYTFIRGSYDSILNRSVEDILKDLNILKDERIAVNTLKAEQYEISKIDLKDDFTLTSIIGKAESGQYTEQSVQRQRTLTKPSDVIYDLSRVIRRIDGEVVMFVKKIYDVHAGKYALAYINQYNMRGMLNSIKLWKDKKKIVTVWNVFEENMFKLTIKGIKFNDSDENVLSIFRGYKYDILDAYDKAIISDFLSLIREVICDNNEEIYNYVISWIACMIQHPGLKNETALILKGLQGTGKNTFTNVICELLAGYSVKNVTDISELTGSFNSVVESKMLIVLNELSNCGSEKQLNFNALKSIITDDTIRINEKNQPRRTAENVANFIFVTNNSFPVKIETGDRRYIVMYVNAIHKGDMDYFTKLHKSFTKEFYDNLLTFFAKYNIEGFNPRNIPMSEAKRDIIEASYSEFDEWINSHYLTLIDGMTCSEALASKPHGMKDKLFQLQIKDKCNRKQKRVGTKREYYYVLKDECIDLYHQIPRDN